MRSHKGVSRVVAACSAVALLLAACGSSSKNSSTATTASNPATTTGNTTGSATTSGGTGSASAPGITADSITVGMVVPLTGSAAPTWGQGIVNGAKARFDQVNAQGGIDGRQLKLVTEDDQSSPAQNLSAVQSLVQDQHSFAILGTSSFMFGGYKYLHQAGIPVVGSGVDGPEWYQQPNTNMVTFLQAQPAQAYTTLPQFVKDQGATTAGSIGYGVSPSSSGAAVAFIKAAKTIGLDAPYLNTSVPFGGVNVEPIALALKQQHIDGLFMPMDNNTNFAIVTAAKQTGANITVPISATGYGQALLDQPTALAAAQGGYFDNQWQPTELKTPATMNFANALKQYAGYTGVPGFDYAIGWMSADLMVTGLQGAGRNPTRTSFLQYLHSLNAYTAGGLLANPANLTLAAFGQPPQTNCYYMLKLQGNQFVPVPSSGKVTCGRIVP